LKKNDLNFEEKKTTYKEVTKNSDATSKNLKSESKKINYDAVETLSENLKVSRRSSTRSTSDKASYEPLPPTCFIAVLLHLCGKLICLQ